MKKCALSVNTHVLIIDGPGAGSEGTVIGIERCDNGGELYWNPYLVRSSGFSEVFYAASELRVYSPEGEYGVVRR